jgi:2-polyprenyl-3-methyl-5-hydroxy-6-metoxy-1,4-benzoquinol methylase
LEVKHVKCGLCGSDDYEKKYDINSSVPFTVVKCSNCGLLYVNHIAKNQAGLYKKGYYTGTAETGFNCVAKSLTTEELNLLRIIYLERLAAIERNTGVRNGRLLDVGCTFGLFLDTAKKAGWDMHGCDISPDAVSMSKKMFGLKNVRTGSVRKAGFKKNQFDVVTLFEVIEHMERPLDEMKDIRNVLKKDGYVVIHTGNLGSLTAKIRGRNNSYFQLGHIVYFSKKTLRELLEKAGFEVVKISTYAEKMEPARISSGRATKTDHLRLFCFNVLERLGISGGMICYARKK